MVSFQAPFLDLNQRKTTTTSESESANSKKRKWDVIEPKETPLPFKQWRHPIPNKSLADIELHLETPLPSEWQRCLDIESGEIHFYNTRTQRRTVRDPRASPEPSSPRDCHMSLDLELNLPCGSLNHNEKTSPRARVMKNKSSNSPPPANSTDLFMSLGTVRSKTTDQAVEMVATACMRCHMLVMLCKSSPTCPNCKFTHPPYQSPPDLFKPRSLSLSY